MNRLLLVVFFWGVAGTAGSATQPSVKPVQFDVVSLKLDRSGEPHGLLQIFPDGDRIMMNKRPHVPHRGVRLQLRFQRLDRRRSAVDQGRYRWDMEAKVAADDLPAFRAMGLDQQKSMLQPVLLERCKLKAHVEQRDSPVYSLTVASSGIRMHQLRPDEAPPVVHDANGKAVDEWDLTVKRGEAHGRAVPVEALLYVLNAAGLGRKVLDRTGFKGRYNFDLTWTPEDQLQVQGKENADSGLAESERPSIFTAVKEQLGLRLETTKAPVGVLVIDHIERPTSD